MDKNKIKNYLLVFLVIAVVLLGAFSAQTFYALEDEKIKLSARDAEIQQLDTKLGLANSDLLSARELNKKYKKDIDGFPEKLQKIIDDYDLQLKSKDTAIAKLQNKVQGGKTTVVVTEREPGDENESPQVISYEWEEELGRFKLTDPDIFVQNNEEFVSSQHMRVVGHVLFGKDGQLQIRRVELQEVIPNGVDSDGNPKYVLVPNSKIELIDSQFEYTNTLPVRKRGLLDFITLRPIASFDSALMPGAGIEFVNLGRLIDYANFGLNARLNADLTDPLAGSLQNSRMTLGVHYQLLPPFLDTNFAIGASVGVPFNNLAQPIFSVDLIFFLTQDLSPFKMEE